MSRDRQLSARRQAGFTLLELLVSLAVLMIALLIANGLFVESVRIYSNSARELREPATELALRLLRLDLHSAAPVGSSADWSYLALPCASPSRRDQWELDGERLVRRSFDLDGNELGVRPMIDGILSFRWRMLSSTLVEVELVRRKPPGASALRASTAAWKSRGDWLEAAIVVAGSRAGGGL